MTDMAGRQESVQILRGIAAMLVVYQHSCWMVAKPESELGLARVFSYNGFAVFGAFGVDLFFVISGFVMALSARRFAGAGTAGGGQFLLQRFLRIAPLLYLITLVIYANYVRANVDVPFHQLVNSFLIVPFFDVVAPTHPLHYFGWTLAYEFVFYFLVTALIAVNRSTRPGVLLSALCLLPLVGYLLPSRLVLLQIMTNWMMWEFAFGVIAFMLWQKGHLQRLRTLVSTASLLMVIALVIQIYFGYMDVTTIHLAPVYDSPENLQGLLRVASWGLPAFVIFCGVLVTDFSRLKYVFPGLLLLGNASYSIYLAQILVYEPVIKVAGSIDSVPADAVVMVLLGLCAAAGITCYLWVESPINRKLQRWAKESYRARHSIVDLNGPRGMGGEPLPANIEPKPRKSAT